MYIFTENVENFESVNHFPVNYVVLNTLAAGKIGPCNLQLYWYSNIVQALTSKMRALGMFGAI